MNHLSHPHETALAAPPPGLYGRFKRDPLIMFATGALCTLGVAPPLVRPGSWRVAESGTGFISSNKAPTCCALVSRSTTQQNSGANR